jgi:hypothetical protein
VPGGYNYPSLYAFDITAGLTTWYAWGEQFNVQKDTTVTPPKNRNTVINSDPAFLYGPALSAKFNDDFNLTFVFLYGNFNAKNNQGKNANFKRIDSDLALNYRLNNYLKVFAGIQYLAYDILPAKVNLADVIEIKGQHSSFGTGIGISGTIPVTGNIFGLCSVSGLYLWGKDEVEISDPWQLIPAQSSNVDYKEYGVNSNLSIAYYIAEVSTVISLGGRFQYIYTDYKGNELGLSSIRFKMYGVTLTATYSFSI